MDILTLTMASQGRFRLCQDELGLKMMARGVKWCPGKSWFGFLLDRVSNTLLPTNGTIWGKLRYLLHPATIHHPCTMSSYSMYYELLSITHGIGHRHIFVARVNDWSSMSCLRETLEWVADLNANKLLPSNWFAKSIPCHSLLKSDCRSWNFSTTNWECMGWEREGLRWAVTTKS